VIDRSFDLQPFLVFFGELAIVVEGDIFHRKFLVFDWDYWLICDYSITKRERIYCFIYNLMTYFLFGSFYQISQ